MLVARRDDFFITPRTTRLNDGRHTGSGGGLDPVREREVGVACQNGTGRAGAGFADGDRHALDAVGLPCADTDNRLFDCQNDRI